MSSSEATYDDDQQPSAVIQMGLTVAAVARRLGIAPDTLRTWDRRYGLGATAHSAGSHRRYSAEDIARLDTMRALVTQGVAPAEAARIARETPVEPATLVVDNSTTDVTDELVAQANRTRAGGGNVLSLEGELQSARGLSRAATMLDAVTCHKIVRDAFATLGVIAAWDNLIVPVLVAIGKKWEECGQGVEVEHLLAEVVTSELRTLMEQDFTPLNARPVVLVSAPTELHTLPLYAIAAVLAERNVAARVLGARTPADAVANACSKLGPSALIVWSQTRGTADSDVWDSVPNQRPAVAKFAAGPGWVDPLPSQVTLITDLVHAVQEIGQALRVDLSLPTR